MAQSHKRRAHPDNDRLRQRENSNELPWLKDSPPLVLVHQSAFPKLSKKPLPELIKMVKCMQMVDETGTGGYGWLIDRVLSGDAPQTTHHRGWPKKHTQKAVFSNYSYFMRQNQYRPVTIWLFSVFRNRIGGVWHVDSSSYLLLNRKWGRVPSSVSEVHRAGQYFQQCRSCSGLCSVSCMITDEALLEQQEREVLWKKNVHEL